MNPAHLHLMLNHIPVLGTAFCMALVGWALILKSEELKRVSLGAFVIVALLRQIWSSCSSIRDCVCDDDKDGEPGRLDTPSGAAFGLSCPARRS